MSERLPIHIRPARESDRADMLELTSKLWESGHDYVQTEWTDWLEDTDGALLVAEHQGRVVGLGKLSRIGAEDWWLKGLRVDLEFKGRGIATQITEALLEAWRMRGSGAVRLATHSQRVPVHRLCERLGFVKVSEYSVFAAPAGGIKVANSRAPAVEFKLLPASEAEAAAALAEKSPSTALAGGLMDLGWRWAPPRAIYLQQASERKQAWWWRGGQGVLAVHIEQDEDEPERPFLELAACEIDQLGSLLLDYRRLAAWLGYQQAAWNAALQPEMLAILQAAGFERDWEHALFVYSKS